MIDASFTPRDDDDALAAEYVLGVQDLADRSAVEARTKRDPAFAALVAAWEVRFEGLNDEFTEARAPNLLPRIEARLFPSAKSLRRGRLPLLRWLGGAAFAASLVILAVATLAPPKADLVAVLATADNRLSYEVASYGDMLQVTRVAGLPAGTGQVHQLWVIAPGTAPVSLGLLADQPLVVTYPAPSEGWVLAVSLEPEGGSPTGLPTGPVILMAQIGATL
jgi:anti-sigma-K factor RskA